MIYDMMYRDAGNYKKYFRADIQDPMIIDINDDVEMEESGLTIGQFFEHMGWAFSPDIDHNYVHVLGISKDQISDPEIRFTGDMKFGDNQDDDVELDWAVEIPDQSAVRIGKKLLWQTLEEFKTKEEAIKWAQEWLGCDENGNICVVVDYSK